MKEELSKLIKKIRFRQRLTLVLTTVAMIFLVLITGPINLVIADVVLIDYKGIPLLLSILLICIAFIVGFFTYSVVSVPIYNALNMECDPEKFLILSKELTKGPVLEENTLFAYITIGRFSEALPILDRLLINKNAQKRFSAAFLKAQCGFFLGNREMLRENTELFVSLSSAQKANEKKKEKLDQMQGCLFLMSAISDGDAAWADRIRGSFKPWHPEAKINVGLVNYILGVAAKMVGDKEECTYRLMYVKENAPKTFFGSCAANMLNGMAEADGALGE